MFLCKLNDYCSSVLCFCLPLIFVFLWGHHDYSTPPSFDGFITMMSAVRSTPKVWTFISLKLAEPQEGYTAQTHFYGVSVEMKNVKTASLSPVWFLKSFHFSDCTSLAVFGGDGELTWLLFDLTALFFFFFTTTKKAALQIHSNSFLCIPFNFTPRGKYTWSLVVPELFVHV